MGDLLKLQNGSDVRGVALEGVEGEKVNLTEKAVEKIVISFGQWLKNKVGKDQLKVAVGRDSRLSGEMLANSVARGLSSIGIFVYDCGLSSTPSMFMTTVHPEVKTDGAIMITASHLPFNRNGLKFFTQEGGTDKKDIKEILEGAENVKIKDNVNLNIEKLDFISLYSADLVEQIREKLGKEKPLLGSKIIVDAGNGAGGFFEDKVLKPLGADTEGSLFLNPDGNFPNHQPNPENKEAMECIQKAVVDNKADLGIIFDTDVDRAAVVDNKGKSINRNPLVALMSAIVIEEHPQTTVVTDSVTSKGLKDYIEALGGKHHRFKRGYKNVINEAIRLNEEGEESHLAIETSGHCAIKENYFLDDGAYLVTKVLIKFAELKEQGKDLGNLISDLEEPSEAVEFRIKIDLEDFKEYGTKVIEGFKDYVAKIDGWSLEMPNYEGVRVNCTNEEGWCLMRMSLHDPVIPINIESKVEGGCERIKELIFEYLEQYDKLTK